ncbi:MAG TPA: glycosyltransferase family protein [Vicinamibacterales bacterium]|nr:glycosyltransferase family protein [Vicinamibacterales bacterium]
MTPPSATAVLAILQARVSSSRLPRKVLKSILGRPMLLHQLDRVRRARTLDALVVATSSDPDDSAIAELCAAAGVRCYRGSLNDVLDRFYRAALPFRPQHVVRLTGDCPLADPDLIDRVVAACVDESLDYSGAEPSFPDGLDVEVMRFSALEAAWTEATRPSDREHVTQFINRQRDRFRVRGVASDVDLSHLRWTVDEPADFELVTRIYEALYPANPAFTTKDILDLLARQPELVTLNRGIVRNEGLARSLAADPPERR